ncbi:hypothetical protein HDU90_002331 [Geranomyces variabilis]|nr:hypothetical protein HDU90_002331 [Geranomyces variabilis]
MFEELSAPGVSYLREEVENALRKRQCAHFRCAGAGATKWRPDGVLNIRVDNRDFPVGFVEVAGGPTFDGHDKILGDQTKIFKNE